MKKRIIKTLILVFFFSLLLTGCGEKKEEKTIDDNQDVVEPIVPVSEKKNYNLVEGDVINPFYEGIKVNHTFKSKDEKILTVTNDGEITAKSAGKTSVEVYKKEKYCGAIDISIEPKEIVNYNFNENLYNEYLDKCKMAENANSSSFNIKIETSGVSQQMNFKTIKEPFYFEYEMPTPEGNVLVYLKEIGNKYYSFKVNEVDKFIDYEYLADVNNVLKDFKDSQIISEYNKIDTSKIELNKINNNHYQIKCSINDLDIFNEQLQALTFDQYLNSLNDLVIVSDIIFGTDFINVKASTRFHTVLYNTIIDIPFSISYRISFDDVYEFDTKGYRMKDPESIEEVLEPTDFNEPIEVTGFCAKYILTHLEKGYYSLENEYSLWDHNNLCKIYDKNLNELNIRPLNESYFRSFIYIENDGDYYITLKSTTSAGGNFKLTKLNYIPEEKGDLISSKGHISGKYDYDLYTYTSTNENEAIKITNNSDKKLYLLCDGPQISNFSGYTIIKPNSFVYLNPKEDVNKIYVTSGLSNETYLTDEEYEYDYDFTVEKIVNENGTDYKNLDELTLEYGNKYLIGSNYKDRKVVLNATKKGLYSITAKGLDGEYSFPMYFENQSSKWSMELEPGQYVFIVNSTSNNLDIVQLKYNYIDNSDKDINISLEHSTEPNEKYKIENYKLTDSQIIKYHFSLDNDTNVLVFLREYTIYEENGKEVILPTSNSGLSYIVVKLKAGKYYFIPTETYSYLYISIADFEYEKIFNPIDPNDVNLGETYYYYSSPYITPVMTFKYTATEEERLVTAHDQGNLTVFDSKMNKVQIKLNQNYEYVFNLFPSETYYFVYVGNINEKGYISFKKK